MQVKTGPAPHNAAAPARAVASAIAGSRDVRGVGLGLAQAPAVVVEDAPALFVEAFELSAHRGPHQQAANGQYQHHRQRDQQIKRVHYLRARKALATTSAELAAMPT